MVHRPADSRLLTNLLQHEKEYSKQFAQLLDHSNASLASFAAYAAASPPPASQIILAIAGSLAAADEALRRYAHSVDEWRESMKQLKDMEDEVGNIMRDREILVTRLIKASKSQKSGPGSIRDSLLLAQQFPSSSTLSLHEQPTNSSSRPLSGSFSSSTKLAAAQSELQACETHLAAKERELGLKRSAAVRDGLGARMKAMVECGWAWGELGRESQRTLEGLDPRQGQTGNSKPLPHPEAERPSSDFSSIGPSQSASQTDYEAPPAVASSQEPTPAAAAVRPPSGSSTITGSSTYYTPATYKLETVTYAPAVALHVPAKDASAQPGGDDSLLLRLPMPAPHALEGYTYDIPTAETPAAIAGSSGRSSATSSARSTPQRSSTALPPVIQSPFGVQPKRHVLERRITEEELKRRSASLHKRHSDASSSDEPTPGEVEVVENPRFMTEARKKELEAERVKKEREAEEKAKKEEEKKRKEEGLARREEEKARKEEEHKMKKEKGKTKENLQPEDLAQETEPAKGRRRFTFKPHRADSHTSSIEPRGAIAASQTEDHLGPSIAQRASSPSSPTKSAGHSPSKRFLGSIRGFFGVSHGGKQPGADKSPTKSLSRPNPPRRATDDPDEAISDSEDEQSPSKSGGKALQNLFRAGANTKKKAASDVGNGKWETRTDKNIRELARRGIVEGIGVAGPSRNDLSYGAGLASADVANAGVVTPRKAGSAVGSTGNQKEKPRLRASSDVGVASSPEAPPTTAAHGRRLKKNRAGPPVSGSAVVAAAALGSSASSNSVPSASTGGAPTKPSLASTPASIRKSGSRRSNSVDIGVENRRSLIEASDSDGDGMIVDLGRRRRTASELGGVTPPKIAATLNGGRSIIAQRATQPPFVPTPAFAFGPKPKAQGVKSSSDKEYSSDTAALASAIPMTRKKSLTKKKTDPAPTSIPSTISLSAEPSNSAPSRKASVKSTTSTSTAKASKSTHHPSLSTGGHATVLQANGDIPSGTLVSQPGWGKQAQSSGGGLSRNTSVKSSVSVPSVTSTVGGGVKGKKTTLGQGMQRRGSLTASSSQNANVASGIAAGTSSAVHPVPAAPSLMSIVQDVTKTNREGWNPAVDMSAGQTRTSIAGTAMMDIVKAPPRAGRDALVAMDPIQGKNRLSVFSTSGGGKSTHAGAGSATGLLDIRAPGSVFDERYRQQAVASASTPDLSRSATQMTAQSQSRPPNANQPDKSRPPITRRASATARTGSPSQAAGPSRPIGKMPLRSALRNPSPSPSASPIRGTSTVIHPSQHTSGTSNSPLHNLTAGTLPPSVDGTLPWGADGTFRRGREPARSDKGKGKALGPEESDESVDGSVSGNEIFYSDEEEVERIASGSTSASHPASAPASKPNGHANGNGHVADYTSEHSESTASTAMAQPVASTQRLQVPRRRKSVRVSLQPTFSPSPPAIEYDDEEEARNHAPYVWKNEYSDTSQQHQYQPLQHLAAPVPVSPAKQKSVAAVADMWVDSSDDDEDYQLAKKALTRAAKKEKDVTLQVKNRAIG